MLYRYLPFVVKWIQPLGYMTQTAAVWCTVLLAVNRYVALCLPFQASRWATVRIVRLQLLGLSIGLLVLNMPRFFQYEVNRSLICDVFRQSIWCKYAHRYHYGVYDVIHSIMRMFSQ